MTPRRTAFFISDGTGITAETLGHSLLTQFNGMHFDQVTLPFINSAEKARGCVARINQTAIADAARPLIFSTLVNPEISVIIAQANALFLDVFKIFVAPLETELGVQSSHTVGRSHGVNNVYKQRIDAVNFALGHDDGMSTRDLNNADVILIGVSRCGKTPTCLYLGMQFGIRAANYPLVPEDFPSMRLPTMLLPMKKKLFGLSINPERLQQIRNERRPDSRYASLANCQFEVREAEALMRQEDIPYLEVTTKSIEEIATTIVQQANLVRHVY